MTDKKTLWQGVIYGEPASKSNSSRWTGRRLIKSAKALNYSKTFREQAVPITPLIEGDVVLTATIFYKSRRPDLDCSLIQDLLQGVCLKNDRQIKEIHLYWGLDKTNPRAEITVSRLG
jgi:Holliday junction resolvase RusA-like endonuclease